MRKIFIQFLKNPFYIYILSFSLVLLIYQLDWSDLYPPLSSGLIVFFVITFLLALYFGALIDKYLPIRYFSIKEKDKPLRTTIVIYLVYVLEFIYNRGIPIILALKTSTYDYKEFGIPTLHPIIATFSSFYTVYIFHLFLSTKRKRYLVILLFLLLIPLLIFNRGMLLINLTSMLFVYLLSINRVRLRTLLAIIVLAFSVLYFFGVLGNYRITKSPSNKYFLEISKAKDKFINSGIPKEYMWGYIYISSPLANLQNNINNNPAFNFRIKDFIIMELMPDFISKRIAPIVGAERSEPKNISAYYIVSTIFCYSFNSLGWAGIYLMFLIISFLLAFYILLLRKKNPYYITGISILMTFMVYNTFDNMIYFSGISFQLVYPLLWPVLQKIKIGTLVIKRDNNT